MLTTSYSLPPSSYAWRAALKSGHLAWRRRLIVRLRAVKRANKKIPWFHPRQLAVLLLLHLLEGELRLRKHLFLKNLAAASTVRAKIREA
jgi:hypothetical protein